MISITICLVYFRSVSLANLRAALYSVSHQDLSGVHEIIVLDNNSDDTVSDIRQVIQTQSLDAPIRLVSMKHGDATKTHAWSTNTSVRTTTTSWIFFTRADYLLEPGALQQYLCVMQSKPAGWRGFITSYGMHLSQDIAQIEATHWREMDHLSMRGTLIDYGEIDTGVWLMPRVTFESVGGLDERLTAWGHAQTHFQHKLHESGAELVCIPKILYYHPLHSAQRDLSEAHRQLAEIGGDLKTMWNRHPGVY